MPPPSLRTPKALAAIVVPDVPEEEPKGLGFATADIPPPAPPPKGLLAVLLANVDNPLPLPLLPPKGLLLLIVLLDPPPPNGLRGASMDEDFPNGEDDIPPPFPPPKGLDDTPLEDD